MKKHFLLIFLSILTFYSYSQDYNRSKLVFDSITSRYVIRDTMVFENYSKSELFQGINEWISKAPIGNLKLISVDSASGIINGRGILPYYESRSTFITHSFKFEVKENRFRFTFTDFFESSGSGEFESKSFFLRKVTFKDTETAVNKAMTLLKKTLIKNRISKDDF